jgi:UDP:flavonoid glycosyltransferase YjiC (YdhE family)
VPLRVWSNRGLHKEDFEPVPVEESAFDLVIQPGEIGAGFVVERRERPGRKVTTPPVTVLRDDELLGKEEARDALGLAREGRYVLFSLGPGNLKDVGGIGRELVEECRRHGLAAVWAKAPITVRDVPLPDDVRAISVYPLSRCLRAFDVFVGAAGYNACYELVQAGIPGLLVPNTMLADDQARRAALVARHAPVVVSSCETREERREAVARLLAFRREHDRSRSVALDGAERAADEILALVREVAA